MNNSSSRLLKIKRYVKRIGYLVDDVLGYSNVRASHENVKICETNFKQVRTHIERLKVDLQNSSNSLEDARRALDCIDRTSQDYLTSLSHERSMLIEHRKLLNDLELMESTERNCFQDYCTSVRNAYETERFHSDQTRLYSLVFSISCTVLGLIGSTWLYKIRERNHRDNLSIIKSTAISSDELENAVQKIIDNNNNIYASLTAHIINKSILDTKIATKRTYSLNSSQFMNRPISANKVSQTTQTNSVNKTTTTGNTTTTSSSKNENNGSDKNNNQSSFASQPTGLLLLVNDENYQYLKQFVSDNKYAIFTSAIGVTGIVCGFIISKINI